MSDQDHLKTDVALIKKDIKTIERFFDKVDTVMSEMSDMAKGVAVQQQIIEHFDNQLSDIKKNVEEHKQEDIARTKVLHKRLEEYRAASKDDHKRLSDQNALNRSERNKEIMDALSKLNGNLDLRMNELKAATEDQESRLRGIENGKWWILGMAATVAFVLTMASEFDLMSFIG
jgi:hypothetical protein